MPGKGKKRVKERFLGVIETEIAGIQYHDGEVGLGEPVGLVREPDNPHDRHAIRVDNLGGETVGYVRRRFASYLTPLVEAGMIRIEGRVSRYRVEEKWEIVSLMTCLTTRWS